MVDRPGPLQKLNDEASMAAHHLQNVPTVVFAHSSESHYGLSILHVGGELPEREAQVN